MGPTTVYKVPLSPNRSLSPIRMFQNQDVGELGRSVFTSNGASVTMMTLDG